MAFLTLPLLALSSLLICSTEASVLRKRVSVAQVQRYASDSVARVNPGAFHLAKSYTRYHRPISQELRRGAGQRGAVTSVNKNNDAYWVSPVDIDGQVVNLSMYRSDMTISPKGLFIILFQYSKYRRTLLESY